MKVARLHEYGGPDVLIYEDVSTPEPSAGQVLIKVEAASVNYADVVRRNNDRTPFPRSFLSLRAAKSRALRRVPINHGGLYDDVQRTDRETTNPRR